MLILKQSTAYTAKIGPFLDSTDGNTVEDGLTISQADVRLSKNGGNIAQKNESTACTHDELGYYDCPLDDTDTGTLGKLQLFVHESGALPVFHDFMVVTANIYDTFFSTDKFQVHVDEMTAGIITATVIADGAIDAATFAANAITSTVIADDAITAAKLNTGAITADAFAANAIVAATLAADCITEAKIADNAIAAEHLAAGAIDFATFAADCKTGTGLKANVESISANAITATAINADAITSAKIADDAISSEHINTGAFTADAFAADAIVAATLATGCLTADAFAADALVAATFATGCISADAIADNAIDAGAIAADAITAAKIADGAIDAATFAAGAITAAAIASNAIDADALAADAVDEIHDEVVEGTTTLRQAVRLILSVLTGKSSGGGTGTVSFRDIGDTKARVTADVDANGNRTDVTARDGS